MADAKNEALVVGGVLADLEADLGAVAGMVMQAAIYSQVGVAETALGLAEELHGKLDHLDDVLGRFHRQLQK